MQRTMAEDKKEQQRQQCMLEMAITEPGVAELYAMSDLRDNILPKKYPKLTRQELEAKAKVICTPKVIADYQKHLAKTHMPTKAKRMRSLDTTNPPAKRVRTTLPTPKPSLTKQDLQLLEDYRFALDGYVWDKLQVKVFDTFGPKKEKDPHPIDLLDNLLEEMETFHKSFVSTSRSPTREQK